MSAEAAGGLRSRLYECRVLHERSSPRRHRFDYGIFYLGLDLDEIAILGRRLRLFSANRWNLFSFVEKDHLPTGAADSLKGRVAAFCAAHGADLGPNPSILLVTLPRIAGYGFNPISMYFCRDSSGSPACAVAEVTNTYREVKPYFLPPAHGRSGPPVFRLRTPKQFYVSPFSRPDVAFDFTAVPPGDRLALCVDDWQDGRRILHAALSGRSRPLSDLRLAWYALKYPGLSLAVMGRIHWQAFRLWLKGVPHHPKAGDPGLQRDFLAPSPIVNRRPSP